MDVEKVYVRWQSGKNPTHVFSDFGRPVHQVDTKAWYATLQRAGIHEFR